MALIPGYQITEKLQENINTVIYRGYREADRQPVIIKTPQPEHLTFKDIARLKHEYEITQTLNLDGIQKTQALANYEHSLALIFNDGGEISLADFIQNQTIDISVFLNLAIQLADILSDIHKNKVIHKDINPHNILISETAKVKITDFSIASLLSREYQTISQPSLLEGTLEYMSPEQTGRMNRAIDYRTDFYSLGVTFYQMLTGQLPFQATDPMELVHCHIAKQPVPPETIREIPPAISNIILKLLAKTAEDRYQSGLGLKIDLENCLNQLQITGEIKPFILGQQDFSGKFEISQKLYGRETEISTLMAAFSRVAATNQDLGKDPLIKGLGGATTPETSKLSNGCISPAKNSQSEKQNLKSKVELMLIGGYSGIGKSSLVHEIHKPIARQKGYFIFGKFDQFKRNIPYLSLVQAFQDLVRQILTENEDKIQVWKTKILQALGPNGQVIIDFIPEVELIIGSQPDVPQLGSTESQNRFNLVFKNFIHVFTTPENPIVLFLDDLQWVDSASLKLIQLIMTDPDSQYLLMIGAYRDNEVGSAHPLLLTLDNIKKSGATVNQIVLQPIELVYLNQLVADTLNCSEERATPLSEQVFQKTKGNPFFITQFLKSLYENGLLEYNIKRGYWQCDIAQVKSLAVSENVIDFIVSQLAKLPISSQNVLKVAACMGYQFDLKTLSFCYEKSLAETAFDLWQALQSGLVIPLSEIYKFFKFFQDASSETIQPDDERTVRYKFLHDRVQQAAYSLIPESEKKAIHLKIGQSLLKNTKFDELEDKIFDVVNQFNIGHSLIASQSEKDELVSLNLIAGRKAKSATAYESAVKYLNLGLELLSENSWQSHYDLTLALHMEAAESAYLNTNFELSERLTDIILQQATSLLDRVKVYELQIQFYMAQNQFLKAINTGLYALELLGVTLQDVTDDNSWMVELPALKDLENQLEMTDPYKLAALRILTNVFGPAYVAKPEIIPLVILTMVNLCNKYGHSSLAAYAYALYGMLLCAVQGNIEAGYLSGQLALKLLDKFDSNLVKAKVYNLFNGFIRSWKEPIRESVVPLLEGLQSGLETGDIEFAGHCAGIYCQQVFLMGESLEIVEYQQAQNLDLLTRLKQEFSINFANIWRQLVLNLMGRSKNKFQLIGKSFNESQMLPLFIESNNHSLLFCTYFVKGIICYLFKNYSQALINILLAEKYEQAVAGMMMVAEYRFYYSLTLLGLCSVINFQGELGKNSEKNTYLSQVETHQEKMKKWATYAPSNFVHKYELIEAEKARVLGEIVEAMELYDRAIQGAREQKFIQDEALANELAADFYSSLKREKIAQTYMVDAHSKYFRWGAVAKVRDLEERHPQLLSRKLAPQSAGEFISQVTSYTLEENLAVLDLTTVLKASQALSSEIVLSNLQEKLMKILIENAGAEIGVFITKKDNQFCIEAETNAQGITILKSTPISGNKILPLAVINYVEHTKEYVVLDNAAREGIFTKDPCIERKQTKSILCAPIIHLGKLIGIIYLENNLTVGAFTPARLEVLKLLTSQVSISFENAELYTNLQAYSQELQVKNKELLETNQKLELEIAERKRTEAVLYRREQEFKALVENSPDIIVRFDRQLRHVYVNPAIERATGIPAQSFIGKTNRDLQMPEEVVNFWNTKIQKVLDTAQAELIEFDFTTPTELKTFHCHLVPEYARDGSVEFVLGMTRDITERKRVEAEIRQINENLEIQVAQRTAELEALFDTLPDYIFVIARADMSIAFCNHFFARSVGLKNRNQLQGKTIFECFPAELADYFYQQNIQVFESGEILHLQETVVLPDGLHHFDTFKVPLQKPNGEVYALLGTARDITELIETKQALSRRTAQLEATNQELDSFSYSVSHDLRAPLRHIDGFINALGQRLELSGALNDSKAAHYLKVIQDSSSKMAQLIDGLLTLSRLGRRQMMNEPVHLRQLAQEAIALVSSQLSSDRAIEFEVGDLPTVMGDATLLQQVFCNLIENAVKFSRDRHPARIIVGALPEGTIFVKDNGVGFDMAYADQLFGPFQRLHSKKAFEGTGIGLAIVQRIIHRHGGKIWADSQPDAGATFYFKIEQILTTENKNCGS